MRKRTNLVALAALVATAFACSGEVDLVDYDDPIFYLGDDGEFYDPTPTTLVVVDASRDGIVDLDDPVDLTQRHDPEPGYGALFLANLDDDGQACPPLGADAELEACFDAAEPGLSNQADLADLGRIKTAPSGRVGPNTFGVLRVDEASRDKVRLYINNGDDKGVDGFVPFDPDEDRVEAELLEKGVEFGIEGLSVVLDREEWDGRVELTWEIHIPELDRTVSDRAHMDVAPVLFPHHLFEASAVYAVDLGSRNQEFVDDLQATTDAAGVEGGLELFNTFDPWIQDYLLTGYMAMPAPDGPRVIALSFRSANLSYPGSLEEVFERLYQVQGESLPPLLREAGRVIYSQFHGPSMAAMAVYDPDKGFDPVDTEGLDVDDVVSYLYGMNSQHEYPEVAQLVNRVFDSDTLDSFGNTETTPPHTAPDGATYPLGRVYRGRGQDPNVRPDPTLSNLIDAQQKQPLIWLDTAWLLVAHVDETVSFVETDTDRGWSLLYNDPLRAKEILEHLRDDLGEGGATLFDDRYYPNYDDCVWTGGGWDCPPPTPAQRTVSEVLDDEDIMAASARAAVEVDAQVDVLKSEIGLTEADLVPIAFLHEDSGRGSLAYQPGIINGISLGPNVFGAPDPHGPRVDGRDVFIDDVEGLLNPLGIDVHWIETWEPYHVGVGQVHCGSNTRRQLPATPWWEKELGQ